MDLYKCKYYNEDVEYVSMLPLPWEKLQDKTVLLSGASGMIGSFLIDVLMFRNKIFGMNCSIFALSRNTKKAEERFSAHSSNTLLQFLNSDINTALVFPDLGHVDYVFHFASNTHPVQYASDPIGTITTNIIGLINMLEFAKSHNAERFAFASSNEIYGENRGDTELFDELYCGYLDPNTLRGGYPESKRCGESLCQAYISQAGMDIVIPRFTRTYGPTMKMSDTKALSQFIKKGIDKENIVLKSAGTQVYSYQYVADSVSGFLTVLLCGKNGNAYNIADTSSDITLKELAEYIAEFSGTRVVFEMPDKLEASGYSKATRARLDGSKLRQLGWIPKYDIYTGLKRTLAILGGDKGWNLKK